MKYKFIIFLLLFFVSCKDNECESEICNEVITEMISQTYEGKLFVDGIINGVYDPACDTIESTIELSLDPNDSEIINISFSTDLPEIDTIVSYQIRCNTDNCEYSDMNFKDTHLEDIFGGFYYRDNDSIRVYFSKPESTCDTDTFTGPPREYNFLGVAN